MNWEHLRAFLWLRWRLRANQLKRSGVANQVLLVIATVMAVVFAVGMLVGGFVVAVLVLPTVDPDIIMYVWDGLVLGFLFWWSVGLMAELQRSEVLSLDRFLHLPVSLSSAFLINYLSSLFSLTLLVFLPGMVGLTLGLIVGRGPAMLLLLPLLAAFLLMITALTYQFQGWLASLMVNKRRRRTVIVIATAVFVLLIQIPNLLNIMAPWHESDSSEAKAARAKQEAELKKEEDQRQEALALGEITREQAEQMRVNAAKERDAQRQARRRETRASVDETLTLINTLAPPGWLALGAMRLAEGSVLPALLATAAMGLVGGGSLWRSYKTTLRLYTGQFTAGKKAPATAVPQAVAGKPAANRLERQLPWLSEQAAGVALGSFQSLLRAPEAKMALLTPFILLLILGSSFLVKRVEIAEEYRPLLAFGAMSAILLTLIQLIGNQFGFERNGFRVFVLCPSPRKDVLLGKNLAVAPLALGMGLIVIVLLQFVRPMRLSHFLAALPQLVSMYLLFCLLANLLSMLAPMRLAQGSLRATNPKIVTMLLHFAFVLVFPPVLGLTLVPLGIEALFEAVELRHGIPICLILTLAECVGIIFAYRWLISLEGDLLYAREQRILEVVVTKDE